MTTPNEELIKRLRAGAFPTGMGHWGDLHCEAADALQSQAERIKELELHRDVQIAMFDASLNTREKLIAERDTLRAQLAEIAATEPVAWFDVGVNDTVGAIRYTVHQGAPLRSGDKLFTRPMPAKGVAELVEALERLARLGNGDQYGNSDGNMIARDALSKYKGAK